MDLKAPMEFPEGKYNIHCTMEEDCRISGSAGSAYRGSETGDEHERSPGRRHVGYDERNDAGADPLDGRKYDPGGFIESLNLKLTKIEKK